MPTLSRFEKDIAANTAQEAVQSGTLAEAVQYRLQRRSGQLTSRAAPDVLQ